MPVGGPPRHFSSLSELLGWRRRSGKGVSAPQRMHRHRTVDGSDGPTLFRWSGGVARRSAPQCGHDGFRIRGIASSGSMNPIAGQVLSVPDTAACPGGMQGKRPKLPRHREPSARSLSVNDGRDLLGFAPR